MSPARILRCWMRQLVAAYAPRAAAHYPSVLKDPNGFWTATEPLFPYRRL